MLAISDPDPLGKSGPADLAVGAAAIVGAAAAWLVVFAVLRLAAGCLRRRTARQACPPTRMAGDELLFQAALLLLSPVLAVGAQVNVALVPLVFVPLYAVQRMARLSAERHRASMLDPLTGLANRAGLKARFEALSSGRPNGQGSDPARRLALVILDLDRFKHINDALGHHVGDQLLRAVAERFAAATPPEGMVARLGGDEFAVLAHVRSADEADHIAEKIVSPLTAPVSLDSLSIEVTASVGVAVEFDHDDGFATMLRHADLAMYRAKRRGDSVAIYQPGDDNTTPERLSLLADFRTALETDDRTQIRLLYQPQMSLRSGHIVGVEALLRWTHPVHGPISTQEILQVAEHSSTMHLLTAWVIDHVVAQIVEWAAEGIRPRVSLNISARDLYSGDIVCHLGGQLAKNGVPAGQIQLEITESAVMADPARSLMTTKRLADLGVAFALDDYGTGFSSLQRLRRLPLTELKIDRSLVAGIVNNTDDAAIVASTVDMAEALGLRTVAEGVENAATRSLLAALGCTAAQGWNVGHPMPADQIAALLSTQSLEP